MKKQISLKWEIGKYLLIFSLLTGIVVFVFQILLLEPMYESNKINSIKSVGEYVEKSIESDRLDDFVDFMQSQSDTCIMVYQTNGEGISSALGNKGCMIL